MQTYQEPGRSVPVRGQYDVVVCGGGAAGFVAAIAAGRRGAKTLLVERYGFLGGTATAAMMVEFGSMHDGERRIVGGIAHEFLHRLHDFGGGTFLNKTTHSMIFDPESMILVCQEMALEAGVEILLHATVSQPILDGARVVGAVLETKSGRQAVYSHAIIDCTGDGDVAARAGARFDVGSEQNGRVQPISLEILLGNVNATRVNYSHHELTPRIRTARAEGLWPIPTDQLFSWGRVRKRGEPDDPSRAFFFINGTNVLDCDGTSSESMTQAEIASRRQIDPLIRFLREHAPGFEHCYLDRTACQIGVRETRRIRGDYTLTREDVLQARHFDDGVVPAANSIDVHATDGAAFEHEWLERGTHYQIPYRCFLPAGLEGILTCGRCISTDHAALGSARVMVVCMPMGEACGLAAAMAADHRQALRDIRVQDLRRTIRDGGTVLLE